MESATNNRNNLGSEANIHFIDMHPDWLKVQFFGTTSAAGSFDHSLL